MTYDPSFNSVIVQAANQYISGVWSTGLTLNTGTVTASTPVLDLTQTWNNAAVSFTGIQFTLTDTASLSSSKFLNFQAGATDVFYISKNGTAYASPSSSSGVIVGPSGTGVRIGSASSLGWTSASALGTQDLAMFRDASNTLGLRNGTSPQTINIYNTYTDGSNYERISLQTLASQSIIQTEAAGTGAHRKLTIGTVGSVNLEFKTNNSTRWLVEAGGHFAGGSGFAIKQTPVLVSALPSAATVGAGARMFVSDANATTFATVVAGGGSNNVPVYSDGTNWRIG